MTCNINKPIVHRLEDKYADQIDFVYLNIDNQDTLAARQQFDIVARSQYVLIDAQGNIIQKWFGFIDEAQVDAALAEFLASA